MMKMKEESARFNNITDIMSNKIYFAVEERKK
jgi:hypothetical protein